MQILNLKNLESLEQKHHAGRKKNTDEEVKHWGKVSSQWSVNSSQ